MDKKKVAMFPSQVICSLNYYDESGENPVNVYSSLEDLFVSTMYEDTSKDNPNVRLVGVYELQEVKKVHRDVKFKDLLK